MLELAKFVCTPGEPVCLALTNEASQVGRLVTRRSGEIPRRQGALASWSQCLWLMCLLYISIAGAGAHVCVTVCVRARTIYIIVRCFADWNAR